MNKTVVREEVSLNKMRHAVQKMNKIIDWGYKILLNFGAALLALIILTITAGVISRYVFGRPFTWTEELGVFLLVWVSFIGACCAGAKNKHIAINFLIKKMSEKNAKMVEIFGNVLIMILIVLILISGVRLQSQTCRLFSIILEIPRNYYFLPLVISSAYLILITVRNIMALFTGIDDYRYSNQSN